MAVFIAGNCSEHPFAYKFGLPVLTFFTMAEWLDEILCVGLFGNVCNAVVDALPNVPSELY